MAAGKKKNNPKESELTSYIGSYYPSSCSLQVEVIKYEMWHSPHTVYLDSCKTWATTDLAGVGNEMSKWWMLS